MFDINEAAQKHRGRTEVRNGVERRRRWTNEEKGGIVAEATAPGAVIARVARRHDMAPQHLSNWIKAARGGLLALPEAGAPSFVPVVADRSESVSQAGAAMIEIVAGSTVVRVPLGADARVLEAILRALRRA